MFWSVVLLKCFRVLWSVLECCGVLIIIIIIIIIIITIILFFFSIIIATHTQYQDDRDVCDIK